MLWMPVPNTQPDVAANTTPHALSHAGSHAAPDARSHACAGDEGSNEASRMHS